jgi:hypothetical protein
MWSFQTLSLALGAVLVMQSAVAQENPIILSRISSQISGFAGIISGPENVVLHYGYGLFSLYPSSNITNFIPSIPASPTALSVIQDGINGVTLLGGVTGIAVSGNTLCADWCKD